MTKEYKLLHKVLLETNVCSSVNYVRKWVPVRAAPFSRRCLTTITMQRKKTRQTLWDVKHRGDFSQDGCEGFQGWGTRKEWENKFKEGEKTEVKRLFKEYLLGSLSPFQPHHCFLPAFVSLTDSPAHLETWRRFESYDTGGHTDRSWCMKQQR